MNKKVFKKLLTSTTILSVPILALPLVGCANFNYVSNPNNSDNQINDSNTTNNENNTINNNINSNNNITTKPNNPSTNIDLKPVQKPNTPNIQSNNIEKLNLAKSNLNLSLKDSKILNNVFIDDFIDNTKTESDLLNYFNVTGKDLDCSYNLKTISKSSKDNTVSIEYEISLNNQTVTKTFEFSGFYHGKFENLFKEIKNNFSFKEGYSYNYHNFTARDFLKDKLFFTPGQYIQIDWNKILKNITLPNDVLIYDEIPLDDPIDYSKYLVYCNFNVINNSWTSLNPKKPNSIIFSLEVKICQFSSSNLDSFINPNDENNLDKTFNFEVNDFKNEELTTELDLANENQLITPIGAVSYKGKLINTKLDLIEPIGQNAYKQRMGEKFTWEKFKKELMYQVRFALYQQFSDNFSEINYYITNDVENGSVTAVAEGIIKDKSENQKIYPQHLVTPEQQQQTNSLNPGQKVRIEISYSGSNNDWKPTTQSDSSDIIDISTKSFSFAQGCNNIASDTKNLLQNTYFSFFKSGMTYKCFVDDKSIYNLTPNHFIFWSFIANAKK